MTPAEATDNTEIQSANLGPGARLQGARKEMNLSIEEVAARMHLSNDIVDAIEANDFNKITAPIFVKGYLRAYARIVSLNEDEMIQQYIEFYSNEDPPISSTSNLAPEISSSDRRIKIITYLVIIGSIALLAIWWWSKYQSQAPVVSLDAQTSTEIVQAEVVEQLAVTEITVDSSEQNESQKSPEPSETIEIAEIGEPSAVTTVDESAEEVDSEQTAIIPEALLDDSAEPEIGEIVMVEETLPQESGEPLQAIDESVTLQESEVPSAMVASDPTLRVAPEGSDRLNLVANADSWVEISDGTGFRLMYRLVRAEEKFYLTGSAPFTVFFGNGFGIEVTINDENVDVISRVREDNTAWLKIGG